MTPTDAMERINTILAHAWMVRNFLKHAEEIEEDDEFLQVHREIYDFIRAVEPSYQRKDSKEYLSRLKRKLPKLRKASDFFSAEYTNVSSHTNFAMAAQSLAGCVQQIHEILDNISKDESE